MKNERESEEQLSKPGEAKPNEARAEPAASTAAHPNVPGTAPEKASPEPDAEADGEAETGAQSEAEAPVPNAAAPTHHADPAGFRLRSEPPSVMRLSRKAILAMGAFGSLCVGGALTYALSGSDETAPKELYNVDGRAVSERVSAGPRDYGELPAGVPKLGDPLPGDLGGPILAARQEGQPAAEPVPHSPSGPTAEELAEQRAAQENEAAIGSRLFLGGRSGAAPMALAQPSVPMAGAAAASAAPSPEPDHQHQKRAFIERDAEQRTLNSGQLVPPMSHHVIQAGNIISAALITGIRSDLPGQVIAQVTQNVYDSPTGQTLLVPQGARLIGDYDADLAVGQRRVLLVWNRLILPDGKSIVLDRLPASDPAGFVGVEDSVNNHWGGIVRAAGLSTLLGIGAEIGAASEDSIVRAIRESGQKSANEAGQDIVRRGLSVQPTLTIRPGYSVRVLVSRDLILSPWRPAT